MIKQTSILFFVFLFSLVAMSFALILQYAYGHSPCKLCVYQRVPYYSILVLGVFYFLMQRYFNLIYILVTILLLVELGISGYHSLTTFGIIEYIGCELSLIHI